MRHSVILCGLALVIPQAAPAQGNGPVLQAHVANPTGFFRNVCHLFVTRRRARELFLKNTYFNSTAFLFRERYLITAAHNVHSDAYSRVQRIDVRCGTANAGAGPRDSAAGRDDVRVLQGYDWTLPFPQRYARDVAIVRLDNSVCGRPAGRIGPFEPGEIALMDLAGYPGEGGDRRRMNGKRLYSAQGTLRSAGESYLFRHNVVTEKGNSGGPVWVLREEQPVVVGLHVGDEGAVRRFDAAVIQDLRALIDELEAEQGSTESQCAQP